MLRGLTTVNYFADDVMPSRTCEPRYSASNLLRTRGRGKPAYAEFRIGDYHRD